MQKCKRSQGMCVNVITQKSRDYGLHTLLTVCILYANKVDIVHRLLSIFTTRFEIVVLTFDKVHTKMVGHICTFKINRHNSLGTHIRACSFVKFVVI